MDDASSATIERIDYDAGRQRLSVTFRGGVSIVHAGVPSGLYAAFAAAPHSGAFYSERIKDAYPRI